MLNLSPTQFILYNFPIFPHLQKFLSFYCSSCSFPALNEGKAEQYKPTYFYLKSRREIRNKLTATSFWPKVPETFSQEKAMKIKEKSDLTTLYIFLAYCFFPSLPVQLKKSWTNINSTKSAPPNCKLMDISLSKRLYCVLVHLFRWSALFLLQMEPGSA